MKTKKQFLDHLFYEIGKQQFNYELTCLSNEGAKSKWRKYLDVQADENFIEGANNRTIFPCEIVLDIEDSEKFSAILEKIKKDFQFYSAYATGSRGYHIHLFFNRELTEEEKLYIITKYDGDKQKSSNRCMIALENCLHWKGTGKTKELIEEKKGINIFKEIEAIETKNSNPKRIFTATNKIEEASQIFERLIQAERFMEVQPVFYDKANIWWMWNFKTFSYDGVDEIDILNGISNAMRINTTDTKTKTEILNGLKQVGRQHIPKETGKHWIQFKDKIVNVKTREIFQSTPDYFITNPIPWEVGESEETPVMDKFFREWVVMEGVQDESYINTLFEMIAYSGMSDQLLQRLFALTGTGSNGKGCFLSIVRKFLGENNVCTSELKILSSKQFESSALYKKQACFMTEVDTYDMQNTNLLKKLTGEDDIRYEFKGKTPFKDKSSTTCFIATNSLPVTPDHSFAYYRRWLIVDFPHIFSVGRDILTEIPDIEFNNLARKVIRICKEFYEKKGFTNEGSVEDRMIRYEERSNPLMKFIEQEVEEDPEEHTIFGEFYKRFNEYLKRHRLRGMTKKAVSGALRNEGFQVKGRRTTSPNGEEIQTTCVFGVKLKEIAYQDYSNLSKFEITPIRKPTSENDKFQSVSISKDINFEDSGIKDELENG